MAEQDKVTEAQRLLEEIQKKYGPPAAGPAEQPKPQPQPAPAPKEEPGSLLKRAAGIFGGRKEQIDKAAGYACGGKVKAHACGGKVKAHAAGGQIKTIKGPGTSTSDSIPAKVKETGEPILVSNGERILSKKQDQLLGKIAKMLGYESTDALLASGTGRPVGPTLKDGKRAARDGDPLDLTYEEIQRGKMDPAPVGPSRIYNGIPDSVGRPPADKQSWSIGPGAAPTIYDNGGLPTTTDRVTAIDPGRGHDIPASVGKPPSASSGWSLGGGAAPTIYDNGGLPTTSDRVSGSLPVAKTTAAQDAVVPSSAANEPTDPDKLVQKTPGPFSMMTDAFGQTLKFMTPSPFENRTDARREANRAELGGETSPAVKPAAAPSSQPSPAQATPAPTVAAAKPSESPLVTGRNDKGVITAESAQQYLGSDMRDNKVGPNGQKTQIFGTYDGKGVNDILARENKARGEMIDSMIAAQGGNGVGILPDRTNETNQQMALNKLSPQEYARYMLGQQADQTARYGHDMVAERAAGHDKMLMRGQDIQAQTDAAKIIGNPAENRLKIAQAADAEQLAALRGKFLDPKTSEAEKELVLKQLNALNNKHMNDVKIAEETYFDPNNPSVPLKRSYAVGPGAGNVPIAQIGGQQAKRPYAEFEKAYLAKRPGATTAQIKADYDAYAKG